MYFCVLVASPGVPKCRQWYVRISVIHRLPFPWYEWRCNAFTIPIFGRRCRLCYWILQRLWLWRRSCGWPSCKGSKLKYAPSSLRDEKHVHISDINASPSKYSVPTIEHTPLHGWTPHWCPDIYKRPCRACIYPHQCSRSFNQHPQGEGAQLLAFSSFPLLVSLY